jgi:hypothetical protein
MQIIIITIRMEKLLIKKILNKVSQTTLIINNDFDNLLICYQLDRLIKPIDLSTTATDTSSPTNEQTPPSSSSSSVLPTAATLNFFHMKNIIELTVESARLREKQLENEIGKKEDLYYFVHLFLFYS